jgi:O-antigen/teichoic acid export membrane protein
MFKKIVSKVTTKNAKNTLVHYLGSFIVSTANYLFHLLLIRLLLPSQYGEFLSYLSFLYIITIPAGTLNLIVSKHVSSFRGQGDKRSINIFFYWILKKTFVPALLLAFIIILSAGQLSTLLKARPTAFYVLSLSLLTSFGESITSSYLLAFQKFVTNLKVSLSGILLKITLAFLFVRFGLGATGGVVAILFASITSISLGLYALKRHVYPPLKLTKKVNFNIKKFTFYSLIFSTGMLSLISLDMLLVRYFFNPHLSGIYASLSTLGKMIYFGITPLSMLAMMIVSNRHSASQNTKTVISKLSLLALTLGLIGVSIFAFFPDRVILILSGPQYLEGSRYLPFVAFSMFLFGLSNLILTSLFAVEKPKASILLLVACLLQPLLIGIFHQDLIQVIMINLTLHLFLFLSLLSYYTISIKRPS